jgi:hypothetical protein
MVAVELQKLINMVNFSGAEAGSILRLEGLCESLLEVFVFYLVLPSVDPQQW